MQRLINTILISFLFLMLSCVHGSNNQHPLLAYLSLGDQKIPFGVSQITPGSGVTGAPVNTSVQVTFNRSIETSTINASSFRLMQGATVIPGNTRTTSNSAIFTPTSALASSTVYTVTLTQNILSIDGSHLEQEYVWNFTTATNSDNIAPIVSLVTPSNGSIGIAANTSISVVFSEVMDCVTLTTSSFKINLGAISGTVNCSGTTTTFTPSSPLAFNTTYNATLTTEARDLAGNSLGANYVWNFTTGGAPDATPPTVSFVVPNHLTTNVPVNGALSVSFSESMNCSTITTASLSLSNGSSVPGTVNCSGTSATFTPSAPLSYNTNYTGTVNTSAKDLAGNSLLSSFHWSFTTSSAPDTTAPLVSLVTPANSLSGIGINTDVSVVFSEVMDCSTLTTTSFKLNAGAVTGTVNCSGTSATFTPTVALSYNTTYTATISTFAKDLSGNQIASNYSWNFTTGIAPDSTAPTVSFVSPVNLVTNVPINASLSIAFSESMNCGTITTASFTLNNGLPVAGIVTCSGTSATFTPSSLLGYNTNYTATITTGVKDLAGNSIATTFNWSFTTSSAPDTTPPLVSLVTPANSLSGVGVNTMISVVFSEVMDCSTLTTTSFKLNAGAVTGTVNCSGTSVTFTPTVALSYNTTYNATLSTNAKDLAGNSITSTYSWNFTTGIAPDSTPPTISLVTPLNGSTGVAVNISLNLAFSETMNCATITTGSLTLNDGSAIAGTVSCSGTSATFIPTASLAYNTNYTATLSLFAKDLAGNSIPTSFSWSFTTGSAPDTTPPLVTLVSPVNSATNVGVNANLIIAFNEVMDCSTITTATLTISGGVTGTVICSGTFATYTPISSLMPGTPYTMTISTGAKDLANNSIGSYSWNFTTGAAPDVTPPGVTIQNLKNKSIVESGFVIGTASDAGTISLVEVSLDGGATYSAATGTTNWSYKLPSGAGSWITNSLHTITVRSKDSAGNFSAVATVTVRKGTNKDINGDGYVDLVSSEYPLGIVYIFHSSGNAGITATDASLSSRYITGTAADEFGKTLSVGDVNGDGFADVIVGAPSWGSSKGRVYVFHSSGSMGVSTSFAGFANRTIDGSTNNDKFGSSITTGDINGDGFSDLIASSPFANTSKGRVYVFHSIGSSGIADTSVATASCTILGSGANDLFGNALATGNMNGDSFADLAIGAPGNKGKAYVYHGASTGLGPASTSISNGTGGASDQFGATIAVADINGDGYSDLTVGEPGVNSARGQIFAFYSGATLAGITATSPGGAIIGIQGVAVNDGLGYSLTVKDLDNDGKADIIGNATPPASPTTQGLVYIFMSPIPSWGPANTNATMTFTGPVQDLFGWALSTGDVNGDGYSDLSIGSFGYNNATFRGRVYIFHSSNTGLTTNLPSAASSIIEYSGLTGAGLPSFGYVLY